MKKHLLLSALCLLTATTQAQAMTTESILKVYTEAAQTPNTEFAYNADIENGVLTAQYVYRRAGADTASAAAATLQPHLQYRYTYDAEQRLSSRTTLVWNASRNQWQPCYRLDYTYAPGLNSVYCSRYQPRRHRFAQPDEKMTYELLPDATTGRVSHYRHTGTPGDYRLTAQVDVPASFLTTDEQPALARQFENPQP